MGRRRHSLRYILAQVGLPLQLAPLLLIPCSARERGPRIEIACPSPPIAVPIAKNNVLVYELHITNFDAAPLTLKYLEIFANAENDLPILSLEGDKLATAMVRIGTPMMAANGDLTPIDPLSRLARTEKRR